MATYPQGITTFIPSYQPFQLDWNVLARNVQLKQTKYDKNWQKLNNIYGALYNSQVSNPESMKVRDNLLKQIDFDVRRVSGLDLSLQSNVTQAEQIFKPFYENKNLIADIVKTKEYNNAVAYGQSLKTSKNKDERDMYWGGGFEYLNNRMEEFKALPFDQISSFGNFKYTPYVNVDALSNEITKDMGDMTIEYKNGRYIYKDVNGDKIIGTLNDVLQSRLGSDPKVQEFYNIKEYNKRKNEIRTTMANNPGMTEEQAEIEYLNTKVPGLILSQEQRKFALEQQNKVYKQNIKDYKSAIAKGKDKPETELKLKQTEQALAMNEQMLNQVSNDLSLLDGDVDNKTLLTNGSQQVDLQDVNELRRRVIPSYVQSMINTDLLGAAETYSRRNMSRTMKADPYAQIDYQAASSLNTHKNKALFDAWLKAGYLYNPNKINSNGSKGGYEYIEELDQSTDKKEVTNKINGSKATVSKEAEKLLLDQGVLKKETYVDETGKTQVRVVEDIEANYPQVKESLKTYDPYVDPGTVLTEHENVIKGATVAKTLGPIKNIVESLLQNGNITEDQAADILTPYGGMFDRPFLPKGTSPAIVKFYENAKPDANALLKSISQKDALNQYSPKMFQSMVDKLNDVIEPIKTLPSVQQLSPQIKQLTKSKFAYEDYEAYKKSLDQYYKDSAAAAKAVLIADGFAESSVNQLFTDRGRQVSRAEFVSNMHANEADKLTKQIIADKGNAWANLATSLGMGLTTGIATLNPIVGGATAIGAFTYNALWDLGEGQIDEAMYGSDDVALLENAKDNWYNFTQNVTVGDEYENMLESLDQNLNREQIGNIPLPGLQPTALGPGKGKFTAGATTIRIIPGANTVPNQLFKTELKPVMQQAADVAGKESNEVGFTDFAQGIKDKVLFSTKGIDMQDVFEAVDVGFGNFSYKISGPEEAGDLADPDNNEESANIFKDIFEDLVSGINNDKNANYKNITIGVSPMGGGQFERVSVVMFPDEEYIDKKYKGDDFDELREDLKSNGVAAMIPKSQISDLENITILANSYIDAIEQRVRQSKDKSVTYKDDMSTATITFKLQDPDDNTSGVKVITEYDLFNPNTGEYERVDAGIGVGGSSLISIRDNFLDSQISQINEQNDRNHQIYKMNQLRPK